MGENKLKEIENAQAMINAVMQEKVEACAREIKEVLEKHDCRVVHSMTFDQDGKIYPSWGLELNNKGRLPKG
jgi:hypothetical protein